MLYLGGLGIYAVLPFLPLASLKPQEHRPIVWKFTSRITQFLVLYSAYRVARIVFRQNERKVRTKHVLSSATTKSAGNW